MAAAVASEALAQHDDDFEAADLNLGLAADVNKNEVKDSKLLFDMVWKKLLRERGVSSMVFPREVVWLSGAPGAGKGTMIGFLMKERDIAQAFETSSLLSSPEMAAIKATGKLIGDADVIEAVLRELMKPANANGVIVDGFPRTLVQAECIKHLHDKLMDLVTDHKNDAQLRKTFKRPNFSICVLYVDEEESVKRQLGRGKELLRRNRMVADTGIGRLAEARATDLSEEAARLRYRIFKDEVYQALQAIKDRFPFHFVPADGAPEDVKARIIREFEYQSSQDLGEETFELVRAIDPAQAVIKQARTNLVTRLNSYATEYESQFREVLAMIDSEFMHIIKRQALAGAAIVRSNNFLLQSPICVNMVLDVLAERGYSTVLDVVKANVPAYLAPAVPGDPSGQRIICRTERTFIFRIEFPKPQIRRNDG